MATDTKTKSATPKPKAVKVDPKRIVLNKKYWADKEVPEYVREDISPLDLTLPEQEAVVATMSEKQGVLKEVTIPLPDSVSNPFEVSIARQNFIFYLTVGIKNVFSKDDRYSSLKSLGLKGYPKGIVDTVMEMAGFGAASRKSKVYNEKTKKMEEIETASIYSDIEEAE